VYYSRYKIHASVVLSIKEGPYFDAKYYQTQVAQSSFMGYHLHIN